MKKSLAYAFSIPIGSLFWVLSSFYCVILKASGRRYFLSVRRALSMLTWCSGLPLAVCRDASPGDLLTLVEKRLGVRETLTLPVTACGSCALLKLTRSEVRVISCMAQEMSPVSLPQYLKISPKTISAHKRSVMRKLGFKRNEELYHWLRSGGLEQIERPLP